MFDAEGPLAPALLAFAPYDDRYSHIVNRCGRRLATNFILNGSTYFVFKAIFETLTPNGSRQTRVFLEATNALHAMELVFLGPQASYNSV